MGMSRNLMVIAVAVVLVGVYVFAIEPLTERHALIQEKLHTEYTTLLKYRKFISGSKDAGHRLEEARKEASELEAHILPNDDVSVSFARLQIDVQGLANKSGLKVRSVKPLPTEQNGQYTALPLFLDCTGSIGDLSGFMKRLDDEKVFIGIDRLNITRRQGEGLRIKMQLRGLMAR